MRNLIVKTLNHCSVFGLIFPDEISVMVHIGYLVFAANPDAVITAFCSLAEIIESFFIVDCPGLTVIPNISEAFVRRKEIHISGHLQILFVQTEIAFFGVVTCQVMHVIGVMVFVNQKVVSFLKIALVFFSVAF